MTDPRRIYLDTEFMPADSTTRGLISIGLTDDQGRDYYAVNGDMDATTIRFHPWLGQHVWPYLPHDPIGSLDYLHPDVKSLMQIRSDLTRYFGDHPPAHLYAWYGSQDMSRLHSLWDNDWAAMPEDVPRWFHELQSLAWLAGDPQLPEQDGGEHHALADAKYNRQLHEFLRNVREGPVAARGPRDGRPVPTMGPQAAGGRRTRPERATGRKGCRRPAGSQRHPASPGSHP